jgi:hypothetical protein
MQTSARISAEKLHQLGFIVVGNEAVPLGESLPDSTWELDRLAVFAKGELVNSVQAEQAALLQAHKSAVHLFRAGCALAIARAKCKAEGHGTWAKWKGAHDLADTSVNDAIRLYENAQTEDALDGMGITQAKEKYVYPVKKLGDQPPTEGFPPTKRRTVAHQDEDHESDSGQAKSQEQEDLGTLGTLRIGPDAVAKAESEVFPSVSAVDRERKLLVCGRWDRRAKEAAARGIAVLVLPELQEARP